MSPSRCVKAFWHTPNATLLQEETLSFNWPIQRSFQELLWSTIGWDGIFSHKEIFSWHCGNSQRFHREIQYTILYTGEIYNNYNLRIHIFFHVCHSCVVCCIEKLANSISFYNKVGKSLRFRGSTQLSQMELGLWFGVSLFPKPLLCHCTKAFLLALLAWNSGKWSPRLGKVALWESYGIDQSFL